MTLLIAVLEDDCVLLGADSGVLVTEAFPFDAPFPAVMSTEKFMTTGLPSVMWSYAGQSLVADPMLGWAAKRKWQSWPQLHKEVETEYQRVVKLAKKRVVAAGGKDDHPGLIFGVMFAGYIGGKPGVFVMSPPGLPFHLDTTNRAAKYVPGPLGGGQSLAVAAWEVLKRFHPDSEIRTAKDLHAFMDGVCAVGGGLVRPVHVWRVTAKAHEKIEGLDTSDG